MSHVTLFQHVEFEPGGLFEDVLDSRQVGVERVCLWAGDGPAVAPGSAGLVVMGGPMGAYDDGDHAWLAAERAAIAVHVRGGGFYWGVCLGAQLLAASLGMPVGPGPRPEVGVMDVRTTEPARVDPVFAGAPEVSTVLQWHNDTFELPPGGELLATAHDCPHQAFRVRNAWGVQFHLEAPPDLVATWLDDPAYASSLAQAGGTGERLLHDLASAAPGMGALAHRLFEAWLNRALTPPPGSSFSARQPTP